MKKEYTFADFRMNEYRQRLITEEGRVSSYSGQYFINDSAILSRLIQEAGRFCESFASDLFIDWTEVRRTMEEETGEFERVFLFGFREFGVDGAESVLSRYNNNGEMASYEYRSLWKLVIVADGNKATMTLGRVF